MGHLERMDRNLASVNCETRAELNLLLGAQSISVSPIALLQLNYCDTITSVISQVNF